MKNLKIIQITSSRVNITTEFLTSNQSDVKTAVKDVFIKRDKLKS